MRKTLIVLFIISPITLLVIFGHGKKPAKSDRLVKALEYSLEKGVATGVAAIRQRDSLSKISDLYADVAFMSRLKNTQTELSRQIKQSDGLRKAVLSEE